MPRTSSRGVRAAAGILALAAIQATPAMAVGDARVLDSQGRVLTVGNFSLVPSDGGGLMRVEDERILSWELHDQDTLVGYGVVPGTDRDGSDADPVLSRDPARGDVVLAWSRDGVSGAPAEIASVRFASAPDPASLRVLVTDAGDQIEPALIHDEAGWAFLAWIDASSGRQVAILAITPTGGVIGPRNLSSGRSTDNSGPQLGIDATGSLFVAYLGRESATGASSLYVVAPSMQGGGVTHVPNPLVELGLQAAVPTPTTDGAPDPILLASKTRLHLTVLGGTPVAWWTQVSDDHRTLFRYAAPSVHGWTATEMATVDLSTGLLGTVPEALELLEARLRRVVNAASVQPYVPGLPGAPARPSPFERSLSSKRQQ